MADNDIALMLAAAFAAQHYPTVHERVATIHELAPVVPGQVDPGLTRVRFTVVSIIPFAWGWRFTLTDRAASGIHFRHVRSQLDRLTGMAKEEFLFHLTVWRPAHRYGAIQHVVPGAILFCNAVTQITRAGNEFRGTALLTSIFVTQ